MAGLRRMVTSSPFGWQQPPYNTNCLDTMQPPRVLPIDDPDAPEEAFRTLAAGGIIAFPTDTVYGVGADLRSRVAIDKIFAIKGRHHDKALPVLMAEAADWRLVARDAGDDALRLMNDFWPGALTLVIWRRNDIPDFIGLATGTVAVRVPAHEALRRILARTGPIATTSANRSGGLAASNPSDVLAQLGNGLDLLLDGGALPPSAPSTVVDASATDPVILRRGAIDEDAIANALGDRPASLRFRVTMET